MPLTITRLFTRLAVRRLRRRAAVTPNGSAFASGGLPTPELPAVDVHQIDDPESPMRLIRAVGRLGPDSIDRLLRACEALDAPDAVHLDFLDARIDDIHTMRRLEAALDRLERQHIAIRVVGIDPAHPALSI